MFARVRSIRTEIRRRSLPLGVAILLATSGSAFASPGAQPSQGFDASTLPAIVFDLVLLRPAGAVATVLGLGCFAVAYPLSAAALTYEEPWGVFVVGPAEYTFLRQLGEF